MLKSRILLLFLAAFVSSVFAATPVPEKYISDAAMTGKVKAELLLDKKVKSIPISVSTHNGIVTLTGIVSDPIQKKKALYIAHHIKGVKGVKDELVINAAKNR